MSAKASRPPTPASVAKKLAGVLGYRFRDPDLLLRALTHPSFTHEASGKTGHPVGHYESLEFLGDAVLGFVVAEQIFRTFPERSEGEMSRLRASLVSARSLAGRAEALGLGGHLRLGRGELAGGRPVKPSILADVFEAVLGAIYLDSGITPARAFVRREFLKDIRASEPGGHQEGDHKTRLQEIVQAGGGATPTYRLLSEEGPPHRREFEVEARLPSGRAFRGRGRSKKQAEQAAAAEALRSLERSVDRPPGRGYSDGSIRPAKSPARRKRRG